MRLYCRIIKIKTKQLIEKPVWISNIKNRKQVSIFALLFLIYLIHIIIMKNSVIVFNNSKQRWEPSTISSTVEFRKISCRTIEWHASSLVCRFSVIALGLAVYSCKITGNQYMRMKLYLYIDCLHFSYDMHKAGKKIRFEMYIRLVNLLKLLAYWNLVTFFPIETLIFKLFPKHIVWRVEDKINNKIVIKIILMKCVFSLEKWITAVVW